MKKNILIIAVFLLMIAALVIPHTFSASSVNAQEGLITTSALPAGNDSEASLIAAKFIKQISILNRVKISGSLFSDPSFQTLKDWSRPIPEEAAGRPNPFAPF